MSPPMCFHESFYQTHFRIMSEFSGESDQSQGQREGCCMISALCIPETTEWQYYGKRNGKHWPWVCHITAKEAPSHLLENKNHPSNKLSGNLEALRHCREQSLSLENVSMTLHVCFSLIKYHFCTQSYP